MRRGRNGYFLRDKIIFAEADMAKSIAVMVAAAATGVGAFAPGFGTMPGLRVRGMASALAMSQGDKCFQVLLLLLFACVPPGAARRQVALSRAEGVILESFTLGPLNPTPQTLNHEP